MHEILQNLAMRCGGLREDGMRGDGMWIFTEPDLKRFIDVLTEDKDKQIQSLESELFTARAQNQIYKGVIYDSY